MYKRDVIIKVFTDEMKAQCEEMDSQEFWKFSDSLMIAVRAAVMDLWKRKRETEDKA